MPKNENVVLSPSSSRLESSVLGVVIVYHPDVELLKENVNAFINLIDKLLIWDNTPKGCVNKLNEFIQHDKVVYKSVGENIGISKALNYAWRYADKEGFNYLLTMDQDSVWHDFCKFKHRVMEKNEKELCICGPCAYTNLVERPLKSGFETFRWQITSGMLIKIELLNRIGGYNESFVVDCVDIELCLRAKSKGFNSYYCYDGFLVQQYGTPSKTMFLGKERNYTFYSPFRVRGIIGGHILLYRIYKHPDLPREIRRFTKEALKSVAYSRHKRLGVLFALLKGFYDGLFKKYNF